MMANSCEGFAFAIHLLFRPWASLKKAPHNRRCQPGLWGAELFEEINLANHSI